MEVIKEGWYFVIPILTLLVFLLQGLSPFKAAIYSIVAMLAIYLISTKDFSFGFLKKVFQSIEEGAYSTVTIAIACAASGIIVGIISLTGVGAKLSNLIVAISNGQLFIALILTTITGIILGMGLPTTAAYLILASVVAPALVEMRLPILTAHMFVFYYGCISTITPPVALAAYVAAGIAGANANKVGFTAFKFGLPAYILPFMFVYSPALMLQGSIIDIIYTFLVCTIGIYAFAVSIIGYYKISLPTTLRIPIFIAGLLLVKQGLVTDIAGITILIVMHFIISKRKQKAEQLL